MTETIPYVTLLEDKVRLLQVNTSRPLLHVNHWKVRTNVDSEKWSTLTNFCPDQFLRDNIVPVSQENSTLGNFDAASIFPKKFDRLYLLKRQIFQDIYGRL